jgi:hypothetical protein
MLAMFRAILTLKLCSGDPNIKAVFWVILTLKMAMFWVILTLKVAMFWVILTLKMIMFWKKLLQENKQCYFFMFISMKTLNLSLF